MWDSTIQIDYLRSSISPRNMSTSNLRRFKGSVYSVAQSCLMLLASWAWWHWSSFLRLWRPVRSGTRTGGTTRVATGHPGRTARPVGPPRKLPLHAHQQYTVVINVADEHASVSVCCDTPGTDVFFHVFQLAWKWNDFLDSVRHGNQKVQSQ